MRFHGYYNGQVYIGLHLNQLTGDRHCGGSGGNSSDSGNNSDNE